VQRGRGSRRSAIHEGAAALAQRHAAKVFGADKTHFVLERHEHVNKVVTNVVLRRGDLVLFDPTTTSRCTRAH
jgi:arginine/lysine/ornithine decarboxylase